MTLLMLMIMCKATHPPVGDLGRTSGRLRHHREASWEVARHNSHLHLVGFQLGPLTLIAILLKITVLTIE